MAVTLEVTPAEDDGPDRVLLAVTDHGSGLSEEDRATIAAWLRGS